MLKEFKYLEKNYDFKPSFLKDSSEIELKFFSLEESVLKIMEKKQILEKEKKILEYENEQHIKVNFLKISYQELEERYKKLTEEHQKENNHLTKDLKINNNLVKQLNFSESKNEAVPLLNSILEVALQSVPVIDKSGVKKQRKVFNEQNDSQDLIGLLRIKEMQIMSLINQMEKIQEFDAEKLKKHIQERKDINKESKVKSQIEGAKDGKKLI